MAASPEKHLMRRLPVGAECVTVEGSAGVHFRVWAPLRTRVDVVFETGRVERLDREDGGWFSGFVCGAGPGDTYRYLLDEKGAFPDPASRFQPDGPFGPSMVIDPATFHWSDGGWNGPERESAVIYEMHVGTFTREGTWQGAMEHLADLADLGITVIEIMPVADFPGRFGWGYDGVDLFAPNRLYGTPDNFKAFINAAHRLNMGVILDVVYNHFGPDGLFLKEFAADYFTDLYVNEWGEAINFDGSGAGPVREFFLANVRYWVGEFHLDGLRLDATQQIFDSSDTHILLEISRTVRSAAQGRNTLIVAENEPQETFLVRPESAGGFGLDALVNDDFHHSAQVALTGRKEAYFSDYAGSPQELISAAKWGFLYQGQRYAWQKQPRGTSTRGVPSWAFVNFLQNHDQIANTRSGERAHMRVTRGRLRAMTAILLLIPGTPMLFQGQEFAADSPFLYFADHKPDLAKMVNEGRKSFLSQFPRLSQPEILTHLTDPGDPRTFVDCKLDHGKRMINKEVLVLHRDLLTLRREDPRFRANRGDLVQGAVLSADAFVLRFMDPVGVDDRLLLVNLGRDLHLPIAPEPLLAPHDGRLWVLRWSSESTCYGGSGTPFPYHPESEENWKLPSDSAIVLTGEG